MADLEFAQVLAAAKANEHRALKTIGGHSEFRLAVMGEDVYVIPSTGKRRRLARGFANMLNQYNQHRSLMPSRYVRTKNASYTLRLFALADGRSSDQVRDIMLDSFQAG